MIALLALILFVSWVAVGFSFGVYWQVVREHRRIERSLPPLKATYPPITIDPLCPPGKVYFLNHDYIRHEPGGDLRVGADSWDRDVAVQRKLEAAEAQRLGQIILHDEVKD